MHGHARDQDDNIPIGLHSIGKKVDILAYDYFFFLERGYLIVKEVAVINFYCWDIWIHLAF